MRTRKPALIANRLSGSNGFWTGLDPEFPEPWASPSTITVDRFDRFGRLINNRIVARSRAVDRTWRMMAIPVMPADGTAPSEALAQSIPAPIPAGAMPAVVVPTVFFIFENKLCLLNQTEAVCGCAEFACNGERRRLRRSHPYRASAHRSGHDCESKTEICDV